MTTWTPAVPVDLHCTDCGACPDEPCRTSEGRSVPPHGARQRAFDTARAEKSVRAEARRLMEAWRHARVVLNGSASDRRIWAEQGAYDALVDFVEAHDLNETEFDPR